MTFEIDATPAVEAGTVTPMLEEHDAIMRTAPSLVPPPEGGAAESNLAAEHDFEVEWPSGYSRDEAGLWCGDDEAPEWISGPFKVLGEARNSESTGWGVALGWLDRDGV